LTIAAHHVGGRGFGVAFNCPLSFDQDVVHVLYEADEICARAMIAENKRRNLHVLPYCLGGADGVADFHITANPYASSNLAPSAEYESYYCEVMLSGALDGVDVQNSYYDAVYGNENRVTKSLRVPVRSLDSLAEEGAFPLGLLPDFLSLDTQGSEHAILSGGMNVVQKSVLAIATEIEFHPMYEGQPLFSAILDLANRYGFHFAGFTYLQEISSFRAPLGLRAKGFLAFGDAVFLRRIDRLAETGEGPDEVYVKALKLAFIALNFGYLEYAMQALNHAMQCEVSDACARTAARAKYVRFLQDLHSAARELPPTYLHSHRSDLVEQLRRSPVAPPEGDAPMPQRGWAQNAARTIALRFPATQPALLLGRDLWRSGLRPIRRMAARQARAATMAGAAPDLPLQESTPVETVLREYGFGSLSDEVRRRRVRARSYAPHRE